PGDLGSLYGGYYVAELLDALSEEYDAHPALFDEACEALERLAGESRTDVTLTRFELVILREIGQLPAFDVCVACSEPVGPGRQFTFKVSQGGLICAECLIEDAPRYWIHPETAAVLRLLAQESPTAWQQVAVTPPVMHEIRLILNSTISHVL